MAKISKVRSPLSPAGRRASDSPHRGDACGWRARSAGRPREAALTALREKHGDAVIPLVIDLLDAKSCAALMPQILEKAGQLDILHANAGIYIGGDLVDANTDAIDRMLNLNVNVVMKNVHDVLRI